MLITKNISAYNQLATFSQEKWDKVRELVKYIIDNHKEIEFDLYANEEFPNGVDEFEFERFCCLEADDIIKYLKGEK